MQLDGVDVDWVRQQLEKYVEKTRPVNQSSVGDGAIFITPQTAPACGRAEAIELGEITGPILDRLYPQWRSENGTNDYDEFGAERDAAQRLLARLASHAEVTARLGGCDSSPRITAMSLHPIIWQAASAQWSTGHRHEAVLAASKAVNSLLQKKVGRRDASEIDLVKQALSEKPPEPGRARLRYKRYSNDQTARSMRQGVMDFGAGCFGAIRNPVGHLPNDEIELDEHTALERLAALSLFARWIDEADVENP
ncbi:TIGR02391 family protein [Nocardia sp. N2S4-5]|uniref:TIGR02391 family protein n=1 Tax=Nocardia sp. N2S4-5 TaxID=3351565 RepID=UPI0037CCF78C